MAEEYKITAVKIGALRAKIDACRREIAEYEIDITNAEHLLGNATLVTARNRIKEQMQENFRELLRARKILDALEDQLFGLER